MKEWIKDKQPSVAIIIVNYNGAEDTIECVKSLNKINYDNYKIFVIENGSSKKPTKEQIDYLKGQTAYMNDCEPLLCFAQQVNGYGKAGDIFLGISTSGNSKNVLFAATTAHAKGMKVIGLTGAKDSKLKDMSDVCIKVPQTETYMIQELHLPIYHCLCLMLEDKFFDNDTVDILKK